MSMNKQCYWQEKFHTLSNLSFDIECNGQEKGIYKTLFIVSNYHYLSQMGQDLSKIGKRYRAINTKLDQIFTTLSLNTKYTILYFKLINL